MAPSRASAAHVKAATTAGTKARQSRLPADTAGAGPLGKLQQRVGNRSFSRMVRRVQPKLKVGAPNDAFEQEADQIASSLDRTPSPSASNGISPVQRKLSGAASGSTEHYVPESALRSTNGLPLESATRRHMEERLGADFTSVRVHTDASAVSLNRELGARAFTHGQNIYFGSGEYNPHSSAGRQLLGHELVHVVQQSGSAGALVQRKESSAGPGNDQSRAFQDKLKRIDSLLSYGIFDWAITDSEATEAFRLLQSMSRPERAIALKRIDLNRLLTNLPDRYQPDLHKIVAESGGQSVVVDEVQKLLTYGFFDWIGVITESEAHQALGLLKALPPAERDRTLSLIPRQKRKRLHDAASEQDRQLFLKLWDQKEEREMQRQLEQIRPIERGERFLLRVTIEETNALVDISEPDGLPVEVDEFGELYCAPLDISVSVAGRIRKDAEGTLAAALSREAKVPVRAELRTVPETGFENVTFITQPKTPKTESVQQPPPPKAAPDPMYEKQQDFRYFIVHLGKQLQEKRKQLEKPGKNEALQKEIEEDSEAFQQFYTWFEANENSPKLVKQDPGKVYGGIRAKATIKAIEKDVKEKVRREKEARDSSPEILEARMKKNDEFLNLAVRLKGESARRFPYSIPVDSEGYDILVTGDPARQAVLDRIADELMGWSSEHLMDDNYLSVDPKAILLYILNSGYGKLLQAANLQPLEHEVIDRHELLGGSVLASFGATVLKGLACVAIVGAVVGAGIITGGTALVVLGGLAAYSGVTSYMSRRQEIEEKGYDVPIEASVIHSIGDVVGLSQVIEGITGERLGTNERLTSVERSDKLGEGGGSLAVLLAGSRAFKFGQGFGRNLRLSRAPGVPETVEGVPERKLDQQFKQVTPPKKPVPNPNPGPLEAKMRAALPENLRVGFDRWMEQIRSNPNKKTDVEKLLGKMSQEQVEAIVKKPAADYNAQMAESERLSDAKARAKSDPLHPDLAHTEWKDGVTIHYEKTPPDPIEIQHGREIQARTGEPVHLFGDTPANHNYPGIDGTIGEPARPLQLKDVHGPQWLKVHAHDAFQSALQAGYNKVEVHIRIPDSTVAQCKAGWEGLPGESRGATIGWETQLGVLRNRMPLARIVIEASDGVWVIDAPPSSPNLTGPALPASQDKDKTGTNK